MGGDAEFNFLMDRANNTFNPQEESAISAALGCTSDDGKIQMMLESIVKGENKNIFNPFNIIDSIAAKKQGKYQVFDWLLENLEIMRGDYVDLAVKSLAESFGKTGSSWEDMEKMHGLKSKLGEERRHLYHHMDEALVRMQLNLKYIAKPAVSVM